MSNSSDFIHLLSRDYRPAGVTQIKISDKFKVDKRKSSAVQFEDDVDGSTPTKEKKTDVKHSRILHDLTQEEETPAKSREVQDEDASRLVLQLVSKTPAYTRHLQQEEASGIVSDSELKSYIKMPKTIKDNSEFSSSFHKVALGDWESKIEWGGYKEPKEDEKNEEDAIDKESPNSAEALLQKRRNPFLDYMDFDNLISWTGEKEDVEAKAKAMPLILELGVAGQSIARHVLPSHRPTPCVKSDEYQTRIQANWTGEIKSTAELSKGTLRADKEQKERFIAQRQEKRRQMAKDKTNRVTEAMETLNALAGGKGRTITSSLMGPGGTERTGRPSRRIGNASHDTEYVEQLDMVTNHSLFRDLSKISLRQFHRPRLPWAIVRTSLLWQFGIRQASGNAKGGSGAGESHSSSYQAMVMGTHAGAVSKAKIRTEADLTPTEGDLVLLEYCEERPLVQMTKGMAAKIVTYYRGDKSRCPVSAGGGDRPTRKRRGTELDNTKADPNQTASKSDKPHRLKGPNDAMSSTITDWVGKPPQKTKEDKKSEKPSINILPEGVSEILHPKVHGPFIGEIEEGQQVTGLVSNLFVAPIFQHEPEQTDFLMILGRNSGATANGQLETLSVILRELPTSVYTVGQIEPRTRVWAPNTQGEKNFTNPLVSYLIAKVLTRTENREGHGLRLDEIQDRVLSNVGLANNALRQRLKHVAIYDKNTQIWTSKQIGYEDYPGVEALGKSISAEGVAAFEVSNASVTRLKDLGIYQLFAGAHACSSVGVAMIYLAGQMNAVRETVRKVKNILKNNQDKMSRTFREYYEEALAYLEALSKAHRRRHEVAKFIYEELQLAPWHLSGEFHDVHKKGEGTGMMKLTGLGDPSGVGHGFSFLRENDAKPSKAVATGQINQKDKITGTEDDLRKLTMKQMATILRSYGMAQAYIDTLKRWDRVHVIRDLSTKAASDGIGDGLERFARGEKMKLSDQKQMYRDRIQVIWKRQIAALSDAGDRAIAGDGGAASAEADDAAAKGVDKKNDDDDDEDELDDEDDFAAEMEEEMMDKADATKIIAEQGGDEGRIRARMIDDEDLTDAKNLVNLKKEKAEARAAREGLTMNDDAPSTATQGFKRKVVRRRITKTYPDGRVVTTFKFIVHADEVGKIMARLQHEKKEKKDITNRPEYPPDEKQVGHAMFEDEDDFEFSTKGRGSAKGRGRRRGRTATTARGVKMKTQFGKLRKTAGKGFKKRSREEEDIELYNAQARRKGTSNRKERGSIRDRRPHVIFANRLEAIRSMVESRPQSGPFHRAVDQRAWPRYYEVISDPIHLSAIRDKIKNYEYRTTESFMKDFQLMRANAIKFNGAGTAIAEEGVQIFELVKTQIEASRGELAELEEAVQEQMSTKPKKKKARTKSSSKSMSPAEAAAAVAAGDTWADIDFDDLSDDSD